MLQRLNGDHRERRDPRGIRKGNQMLRYEVRWVGGQTNGDGPSRWDSPCGMRGPDAAGERVFQPAAGEEDRWRGTSQTPSNRHPRQGAIPRASVHVTDGRSPRDASAPISCRHQLPSPALRGPCNVTFPWPWEGRGPDADVHTLFLWATAFS